MIRRPILTAAVLLGGVACGGSNFPNQASAVSHRPDPVGIPAAQDAEPSEVSVQVLTVADLTRKMPKVPNAEVRRVTTASFPDAAPDCAPGKTHVWVKSSIRGSFTGPNLDQTMYSVQLEGCDDLPSAPKERMLLVYQNGRETWRTTGAEAVRAVDVDGDGQDEWLERATQYGGQCVAGCNTDVWVVRHSRGNAVTIVQVEGAEEPNCDEPGGKTRRVSLTAIRRGTAFRIVKSEQVDACESAESLPDLAGKAAAERSRLLGSVERMVEENANPSLAGALPVETTPASDASSKALAEDFAEGQSRCTAMTASECATACETEKSPAMCTAMAGRRFDGKGLPANPTRAVKEWTELCKARYRPACLVLENLTLSASRCTTVSNCKEGCDKALGPACHRLGEAHLNGRGTTKDNAQALVAFQRGCAIESAASCKMLGFMHGEGLGVPRSLKSAEKFTQKACDLGADDACGPAYAARCVVDAITPKQRRVTDDQKCRAVRDSGKSLHASKRKTYAAFQAPDENNLNQCLEPMLAQDCFQVNVNNESKFRAIYCCPQ